MHGFGILNSLTPVHYILRQLIHSIIWLGPGTQIHVLIKIYNHLLTEMATKYCAILFVNLGEYVIEFMQ